MITIQATEKEYYFNYPTIENAYPLEFSFLYFFIEYFANRFYYVPAKVWDSIRDGKKIVLPKEKPEE